MSKELNYSFIRSEKDGSIVLFLLFDKAWYNLDFDIGIEGDDLILKFDNDVDVYRSRLNDLVLERLLMEPLYLVFTNEEGDFIHEVKLEQISRKNNNRLH